MFPKSKRFKSKIYKKYIKNQPCCISGQIDVDPHHVKSIGSGGSDLTMIPLSHELHQECHKIGKHTFQRKYDIDFNEIQVGYLQQFIEQELIHWGGSV